MENEKNINSSILPPPAILIEEAQTEIKIIIRNAMLGYNNSQALPIIHQMVQKVIKTTVVQIKIPDLKLIAKETLLKFADKLLVMSLQAVGFSPTQTLYVLTLLTQGKPLNKAIIQVNPEYIEIAQPNKEWNATYMKRVGKMLNDLVAATPKYSDNVSLRNIAEMSVRYDNTLEKIAEMQSSGINLVVSSAHANCSKRCEHWQGGFYTLDNTYQIIDGIQFQPLSNATDQYYTTKSGKVYKNGHITGYNCRHYLTPYKKGYRPIMVSAKTVKRERAVDNRMRELEKQVRGWREKALLWKGIDDKQFKISKQRAIFVNQKYISFARTNNRAYYPSRTKIL